MTAGLSGKLFGPETTDTGAAQIVFRSIDGATRLTVTTAKEPDGNYYLTGVKVG